MMKKARIDGRIVDVLSFTEYTSLNEEFQNNQTAIEHEDLVLPLRGKNDTRPGLYRNGPIGRVVIPSEDERGDYSNSHVIDFTDSKSMKDIINKKALLHNEERVILTTVDNIYIPNIKETDSNTMVGLKQAIIAKNMDITKYLPRLGSSSANDFRILDKPDITSPKMQSICNALDIRATLILEDMSPDVANPMGKVIKIEWTGGGDN